MRCQATVNIFNQQAILPWSRMDSMPVKLPELEKEEESREEEVMEMRRETIGRSTHRGNHVSQFP